MKNMKYLLRLLGAVTLTGLSVTTLVACGDESKPFDISNMKPSDIKPTTKNIIAKNTALVTPDEIINGIMPSVLEGVKSITKNKGVTKNDFTIGVAENNKGEAFIPKSLATTGVKVFVQVKASKTKVLDKNTKWLEYKLPQASVVTDLNEVVTTDITKITKLYVKTPADVTPQEIIDNISQSIVDAVKGKGNNTITNDDIKIALAKDSNGTKLDLPLSLEVVGGLDIYVQIDHNSTAVEKKSAWLEYHLPKAESKKSLSISTTNLTKILSTDAAPSVESILSAINTLNTKTFTQDDITIAINADNKGAIVTGKGEYYGSVNVTFEVLIVKADLGIITPTLPKRLVTATDILTVINTKNVGAGWNDLTTTNAEVTTITTEGAIVTCKGKTGYQGIISVTYVAKVDVTDITVTDPDNIRITSGAKCDVLNTDSRITNLIVSAINALNAAIDVKTSDFTLTNDKETETQTATTVVTFTVTASSTSKKITGTFEFNITLKQ